MESSKGRVSILISPRRRRPYSQMITAGSTHQLRFKLVSTRGDFPMKTDEVVENLRGRCLKTCSVAKKNPDDDGLTPTQLPPSPLQFTVVFR